MYFHAAASIWASYGSRIRAPSGPIWAHGWTHIWPIMGQPMGPYGPICTGPRSVTHMGPIWVTELGPHMGPYGPMGGPIFGPTMVPRWSKYWHRMYPSLARIGLIWAHRWSIWAHGCAHIWPNYGPEMCRMGAPWAPKRSNIYS
jgi:hypothetical protein